MATYKTPGVYIEEIPQLPPSVVSMETAVPAFIGYTEISKSLTGADLKLVPTKIGSLPEYESMFGFAEKETSITVNITEEVDAGGNAFSLKAKAIFTGNKQSAHNLYYALQLYFANGGKDCYIISVGTYSDTVFGNKYNAAGLQKGLDQLAAVVGPTLTVIPEGKSIDSSINYYSLQNNVLAQCAAATNRFALIDAYDTSSPSSTINIGNFRNGIGADNLNYGAAYYPDLITQFSYRYDDAAVTIIHQRIQNGNSTVVAHGSNKLNDPSFSNTNYYTKARDAISALSIVLPPSAAVAGIYVAVDAAEGIWKAPANISPAAVNALTHQVNDNDSQMMTIDLTGKSVNPIRLFTGRGILIWGARTLDGNSNDWRYINVRRLISLVEGSVKIATEAYCFEPNVAKTWVLVKGMIENYLVNLWKQGGLMGSKPSDAFFVSVGLGSTMTAMDLLEGRMIVQVAMAVVRPAEFIIISFSQKMLAEI